MKTPFLFSLFLVLVASSCGNKQTATNPKVESKVVSQSALREVIFYTPSTDELYQLSLTEGDENGTMSVVDDFEFYAHEFLNNSGISGLQGSFTTDKLVIIRLKDGREFKVERDMETNVCGAIFNDGVKDPLIVSGIRLDLEYRKLASEFFENSSQ